MRCPPRAFSGLWAAIDGRVCCIDRYGTLLILLLQYRHILTYLRSYTLPSLQISLTRQSTTRPLLTSSAFELLDDSFGIRLWLELFYQVGESLTDSDIHKIFIAHRHLIVLLE